MTIEYLTLAGIIIQTAMYLLGGYALVIRSDQSNKDLKEEVEAIQSEIKALSKIVSQMAVQEERLTNLSSRMNMFDRRMDDVVRQAGWVTGRRIVDGEYP